MKILRGSEWFYEVKHESFRGSEGFLDKSDDFSLEMKHF